MKDEAARRGKAPTTDETGRAPRRTRGPSPEKTARTRAAIIDAAMVEFLERGFSGATMAGVARRAALAKGTPYLYFEGKEALFAAIVRNVVTQTLVELEGRPMLPEERLGDYLRRTLVPLMRNFEPSGRAKVAQLVLTEGTRFPELAEVYRREVFEPMHELVRHHARLAPELPEPLRRTLVDFPQMLFGPLWVGMVQNGILGSPHPVDMGEMFARQIDLLFPPTSGTR